MWKTNLTLAIRSIWKNKSNSFINLAGLTVGITACLLIAFFVQHERSYDRWNPQLDRLVRVTTDIKFGETRLNMATSGAVVGPEAKEMIPEIKSFARIRKYSDFLIKTEQQTNYNESEVLAADQSLFELFPTPILAGDVNALLVKPNTLVLSEPMAKKYFGNIQNAIGKNLVLNNNDMWQVTGVFADFPYTNHFKADFVLSLVGNEEVTEAPKAWAANCNFHTYFLLQSNTNFTAFAAKWNTIAREKLDAEVQKAMKTTLADFEATGQHLNIAVQPVADIHLHSALDFSMEAGGDIRYVWMFSLIGLMILLIACINYMNLSTAKSANRTKEIAVRKVLGSQRRTLIQQFLTESIALTAVAFVLAIGIAYLLLPAFSELTERQIAFPENILGFIAAIVLGIVGIGILAGGYPAFFLSGFNIQRMLRGQLSFGNNKSYSRNFLVVVQFTASTVLIISTLFIYRQLNYIQDKKLGFNKEQVITVKKTYVMGDQINTFKQEMLQLPTITAATVSSSLPTPSNRNTQSFMTSREFRQDNGMNLQYWATDPNFLNTLDIELVEGRYFDKNLPTDSTAIVLNETAVKTAGFTNPIGKKIYNNNTNPSEYTGNEDFISHTIIGVIKDFHWSSLRDNIEGLALKLAPVNSMISFRFQGDKSAEVIAQLEQKWQKMVPDTPFEYEFMDDAFAQTYRTEQRIGIIALLFTGLAIFVSCMGLLGLVAYMVEQRTREIGIRKVLGASVTNIVGLLSKDFMILVVIALVIAIPIAYYFMSNWLSDFAYHIELNTWTFASAGVLTLVVALITVGIQALQAALTNPVDAIQND